MHSSVGDIVYYLPEVFVVKSQMPSGVFRVEGLVSKTREVAAADTLYTVTLVSTAEIDEEGLSVLRNKNEDLMTERHCLVFQLDDFFQLRFSVGRRKQTSLTGNYVSGKKQPASSNIPWLSTKKHRRKCGHKWTALRLTMPQR